MEKLAPAFELTGNVIFNRFRRTKNQMVPKAIITTFETIWKNFVTLFHLVDHRTLLAPLLLTILLWAIIWTGFIRPTKQVLETAAVVITGLLTLGLIVRFAVKRHLFLLWAIVFMALAMSREIHFSGSDEALLIGWPILFGIALWRYDVLIRYLENPVLINLFAGGFLFYILSQTIDQRWWKGIPGENVVHVPLEELIEILGHCTIGFALLFSRQVRQSNSPQGAGSQLEI